jgi:hypothetical protein
MMGLFDEQGEVTDLALAVAPFIGDNVSARLAACIGASQWYPNCIRDTITAVAIFAGTSPLMVYPSQQLESAIARHRSLQPANSRCDLTMLLAGIDKLDEAFKDGGRDAASRCAREFFLNLPAYLEIRDIRERLLRIAQEECGWELPEPGTVADEDDLTGVFFQGFGDRMMRRVLDPKKQQARSKCKGWEPLRQFYANIPEDSVHNQGAEDEVLLLFLAVIWRHGTPEGGITAAAINAISPAQVARLLPQRTAWSLESLQLEEDQHRCAYDVWYLDDTVLCRVPSQLPPGTPLEALNTMSMRTLGALPRVTWSRKKAEPTWADLVRHTGDEDLQVLLAEAWLTFGDHLELKDGSWLPITYMEDGRIVITVEAAQAAELLLEISRASLPKDWRRRDVWISVPLGEGEPLSNSIDNLGDLIELLRSE